MGEKSRREESFGDIELNSRNLHKIKLGASEKTSIQGKERA